MGTVPSTDFVTRVDRIWLLASCRKILSQRYRETVLLERFDECIRKLFENPRQPGLNLEKLFVAER